MEAINKLLKISYNVGTITFTKQYKLALNKIERGVGGPDVQLRGQIQ